MVKVIKFKDQCDRCNKFKILKGYKEECLCIDCLLQILKERNVIDMDGIERIKVLAAEITDKPLLKIIEYLLNRSDMNEKYLSEEKSLSQMVQFIKSEAKKQAVNGVAMIEDEEVFGWAIHYFDETNENLGLNKKPDKIDNKKDNSDKKEENCQNEDKPIIKKEYAPEGPLQLTLF